jgi:flagellar hook-associated protein 1 FlgK
MSSLMGLVDLARGALQADQAALNATAANVANQNTVGYTDQVVSFRSGDTVTLTGQTQLNQAPTANTTSLRDRVLEQRVQQQMQSQSGTAAEAAVMSQVEGVFSITGSSSTSGSTQLGTALNGLSSALTALAANPADQPTQQAVLSAAQTLTAAFNAAASGLASVQTSINGSVASSVAAVNSLTRTIAQLNGEISAQDPNKDAGSLEDQRQSAIEQLSQYIGLNQISTESNGITLTATNGSTLVAGQQAYALSSQQVGATTEVHDSLGVDMTTAISGGSIGGQLQAQNLDLPVAENALDALAYRVATTFNTQNEAGQTSAGVAGAAIFSVPAGGVEAGAAAAISVIPGDPGAIATAAIGQGATGNGNANAFGGLLNATDGSGTSITGNLASMLSGIGSSSAALQQQSTNQQASLTQLTTMRDGLSAVNLDTEAANLTTYQRSYQAAAQVFTIVDQLLAAAINLGTQTTVS